MEGDCHFVSYKGRRPTASRWASLAVFISRIFDSETRGSVDPPGGWRPYHTELQARGGRLPWKMREATVELAS